MWIDPRLKALVIAAIIFGIPLLVVAHFVTKHW
jgi:hypothetical protein